jgi:hypothetical protein
VRARPFYFEIKDMLTQFVAAFDDIVIGRFNKHREEKDKIQVRYVYAPKQRVLYDLINENKTLTLPVVSVSVKNISRDTSRVFNKLDGFYYQGKIGDDSVSRHIKSPVPINISLSVSVLTRYQTDMDQILSNFVPFCNPYVIISWKVPEKFNLSVEQEIRSEVLWTGDVSMQYPTDLASNQKARVTADTSFTIKGWLFKDTDNPSGNIFYIDTNFHNETELEYYDNFESLSGNTYTHAPSTLLEQKIESRRVKGSPFITDIFYNNVLLQEDLTLCPFSSGNVILAGEGFSNTDTVLFSCNNESAYTSLTTFSNFDLQEPVSGQPIPFTILNDNLLIFNSPVIESGRCTFIPLNIIGYDSSFLSFMDPLCGRCGRGISTFIDIGDFAPVINLNGHKVINIPVSGTYIELGATAIEDCPDGILPVDIYGDTVDTSILNSTYTILYSAADAAGNIGTNFRTVNIVDVTAPVVTINGSNTISIECGTTYTELCATSTDNIDGSLPVTIAGDTVNNHSPGTYIVQYLATDSSGNVGSTTRTVTVVDTTAPVVTLSGASTITIECGDTYNELNAAANDACDGVLPVTIGGDTVNIHSPGSYTILYSATDSSGNTGTNTRTVVVEDTTAPVVTLNGSSPVTVGLSSTYIELSATANDACDGVLPVTIGGDTVNTSLSSTYVVTYSATDSSGNTGTNTRTVIVSGTPPEITLNGTSSVSAECGSTYEELSATAFDNEDGSLPVTIGGDTVDTSIKGTYVVTYSATDSDGNTVTENRTVNVLDTIAPVVTLNGTSPLSTECDSIYTELSATALDACDGVLPVTIGGDTVDNSMKGTYTVTYSATDHSGNVGTNTRTVVVVDTTAPVVTLNGTTPVSAECGSTYTELSAIANDGCDGTVPVTIGGDTVDTGTKGTYVVTYSATDSSGNTGTNSRTVNVLDTIPPVVTLNGSSPVTVTLSSTYTELSATANDACDGVLPVTIGGDTVNANAVGTYVVTYSATDSSGNTGTNTRTVNVSGSSSSLNHCLTSQSFNNSHLFNAPPWNISNSIKFVAGSSTPPTTGWKLNSSGPVTEPAGYLTAERTHACLRGIIIEVDSAGNIIDSIQAGTTTPNNLDLKTLLINSSVTSGLSAGCYSYIFQFYGWYKPGDATGGGPGSAAGGALWASADDEYRIYNAFRDNGYPGY